jgi:8-oxo-dGTP pyrophosphatase MutT (NUDIX family)
MTAAGIRDAATVILVRDRDAPDPRVLVGQRGKNAVFMPSKFVFPGGAVDPADSRAALAGLPGQETMARLSRGCTPGLATALLAAAVRELWEEAGLVFGQRDARASALRAEYPEDWHGLLDTGALPSAEGLDFVFRAITPPGRPRRFDARFFLADAARLLGDPDDFSRASDELSHLHWARLSEVRRLDMPFITEVVLAEVQALLGTGGPPSGVPFFHHDDGRSYFDRL